MILAHFEETDLGYEVQDLVTRQRLGLVYDHPEAGWCWEIFLPHLGIGLTCITPFADPKEAMDDVADELMEIQSLLDGWSLA